MAQLDIFTGLIPTTAPQLRWSTAVGGEIGSRAMLVPGGRVVVGDKNKKVSVLDCATGAIVWSTTLNYPTYYGSPNADSSGNIYAASWQELHSFSPTGTRRWKVSFVGICQAPLQVDAQGNLYLVTAGAIIGQGSTLSSYNSSTGALNWSVPIPSNNAAQSAPALLGNGQAIVGSDNGDLLYIRDGSVVGQMNLGASVRCNPLVVFDRTGLPSQVIVATGTNNDPTKHKVYAIDVTSLPLFLNWTFCPADQGATEYLCGLTSPVITPGGITMVGYNGHLWGLGSGGVVRFSSSAACLAGPIAMDGQGNAIVARERRDMVAVDLNGDTLWTLDKGGLGVGAAIDDDGNFYFGTTSGTVYSYGA